MKLKTLVLSFAQLISAKFQGLVYGRLAKCESCQEPCKPNSSYGWCDSCLVSMFGTPEDWQAEYEAENRERDSLSLRQKIEDVLDPEELGYPDVQDQQPLTCCKCGKINPDMWDPFTDTDWCLACWYKGHGDTDGDPTDP